mgnify:CR=1 FL=1
MPRKTKEELKEETKVVPTVKKTNGATKAKSTTRKKISETKTVEKKSTANNAVQKKSNNKTEEKKSTVKKSTVKKSTVKKSTTASTKKKSTTKKASSKKATSPKKTTKNIKKAEILEYYDLPYRYNETTVKVLAQTPNTLFVYWDISDDDKKSYIEKYGEYFFNNTKPVLVVHNKTNNSTFEVDINDFANSWYLHILDSDCDYQIDLGRRPINNYVSIENDYLYVTSSNEMETPNDHILFDHLNNNIYFKNVKTNTTSKKNIANLSLLKKISKISDIKNFYQALYPEEMINFERLDLSNPSSSNPTSSFK